jgi:uncharacterized protein DUF4124
MIRNVILALAILVVAVVPVRAADMQGAGRGLGAIPGGAHPSNRHLVHHYPFNRRPFIPYWGLGVYAPPLSYGSYLSYAPAPVYEAPPVYEPPPVYSQPGWSGISIESGPPPMPSVIVYPNGQYELRGDGFTSPYRWVWVPNPPPAPPSAPPVDLPVPGAPPPPDPPASQRSRLYRWVDEQGVVHYTQGRDAVPEQYRAQLKLAGTP